MTDVLLMVVVLFLWSINDNLNRIPIDTLLQKRDEKLQ